MTRKQAVLDYIMKHGSITSAEAFAELGNTRLSASVFELRREGHPIAREMVEGVDRNGERVRYARYTLAS